VDEFALFLASRDRGALLMFATGAVLGLSLWSLRERARRWLAALFMAGCVAIALDAAPAMAQEGAWEWRADPGACPWSACDVDGAGLLVTGGAVSVDVDTCYTRATSLLLAVAPGDMSHIAVDLDGMRVIRSHYVEEHAVVRLPATGAHTATLTISSVGPYTGALAINRLEARCVLPRETMPRSALQFDSPNAYAEITPYDYHRDIYEIMDIEWPVLDIARRVLRSTLTFLVMFDGMWSIAGAGMVFVLPLALLVISRIIQHTTENG